MNIDLEQLKRAAQKAAQGPWTTDEFEGLYDAKGNDLLVGGGGYAGYIDSKHDARFIAAANPAAVLDLIARLERAEAETARLDAIVNTPQFDDFIRAVSTEAEHQRQRLGSDHDAGKAPSDWFWLIGYLGGKALHAHAAGNIDKAEHHVITAAAVCCNWHRAMFGKTDMRPGIADPEAT